MDDPCCLAADRLYLAGVPRRANVGQPDDPYAARSPHERDQRPRPRHRLVDPVRGIFLADVPARAGRFRARSGVPADPVDRAAPRHRDADGRDVQCLQLVHPAGGAVFPTDRQPDERRRHHQPADALLARPGRAFPRRPGTGERRAFDFLCRHLGFLNRGCGQPVEDLHRSADQGRLRPVVLGCHHCGVCRAGGDHSAFDPDDRLGRRADRVDRRAVSRRHHPWAADRAGADGDRARVRQGARLSDLSARHASSNCCAPLRSRFRR